MTIITAALVSVAEWALGLLIKTLGEELGAYFKAQLQKVQDVKAALAARADIEAKAKASVVPLQQAKTKEEIDAATDDTLNNT